MRKRNKNKILILLTLKILVFKFIIKKNFLVDEVILFKSLTWGKPTSRIPGQNGRWISDRNTHVAMKDFTELRQFEAVLRHSI